MPAGKGRFGGIALAVAMLVLFVLSDTAQARAGGGQSYGGGSGGGGDGGGDGLGFLVYFLVRLCIEQPCIGIPLTIAIIVGLAIYSRQRKKMQEKYIARSFTARRESAAAKGAADLDALKNADPAFTETRFTGMAATAFASVQKAWSSQDLSAVTSYISDGVRERFNLQFDMQRAMGYRNSMENLEVLGVRLVGAHAAKGFQTVHAEIHAKALDCDVSIQNGRKLRTNTDSDFFEYWTFMRKSGAKTPEKGGLVQGFCPNCGASLSVSNAGKCEYCGAHITSGTYDWILVEITQESEWKPASAPDGIPGYSEMKAKDPGFMTQPLEDTVSVVFWRYVKSYFEGRTDAAVKVASPEFIPSLERNIAQTVEGEWHLYFHDAAVGSVEILDIVPGQDKDRVRALVKWSAWNRFRNAAGQTKGAGDRSIRPQVFTLARLPEVRTRTENDFHSAHCPGCGAPYTGAAGGACEYCGRPLNDGSGAWVLEDISAFSAGMLKRAPGRAAAPDPEMLLMAMVAAMFADGTADGDERRLLDDFAASRGVSAEKVSGMIAAASQGVELPRAEGTAEAKAVLSEMVGITLADGSISSGEMKFLEGYTTSAGLSPADLRATIAGKRRSLYKEARKTAGGTRPGSA